MKAHFCSTIFQNIKLTWSQHRHVESRLKNIFIDLSKIFIVSHYTYIIISYNQITKLAIANNYLTVVLLLALLSAASPNMYW